MHPDPVPVHPPHRLILVYRSVYVLYVVVPGCQKTYIRYLLTPHVFLWATVKRRLPRRTIGAVENVYVRNVRTNHVRVQVGSIGRRNPVPARHTAQAEPTPPTVTERQVVIGPPRRNRREPVVIRAQIHRDSQPMYSQISGTGDTLGQVLGSAQSGHENTYQKCYDGNYDQQLDKRETMLLFTQFTHKSAPAFLARLRQYGRRPAPMIGADRFPTSFLFC